MNLSIYQSIKSIGLATTHVESVNALAELPQEDVRVRPVAVEPPQAAAVELQGLGVALGGAVELFVGRPLRWVQPPDAAQERPHGPRDRRVAPCGAVVRLIVVVVVIVVIVVIVIVALRIGCVVRVHIHSFIHSLIVK